jgi:FixJ family two-component response regulator
VSIDTVFIVSEDPVARDSLAQLVGAERLYTEVLPSLEAWLEVDRQQSAGCLVLNAAAGNPFEPTRLAAACARISVLVLSGRGDISTAVDAIRQGAVYVLQIPCSDAKLLDHIKWAMTAKTDGNATS